jgi:curved DNA-binding protein CbpA
MFKALDVIQKLAAKKLGIELPENGRDWFDAIEITTEEASAGGKVRYLYNKRGNTKDLLVKIPPGMRDGQQIKLKGLGGEGKHGGGAGDLYLKVEIHRPFLEKIKKFLKK